MKRLLGTAVAVLLLLGVASTTDALYAAVDTTNRSTRKASARAKPIQGKVVDVRGRPVGNAEVLVVRYTTTSDTCVVVKRLHADKRGRFSCAEPKGEAGAMHALTVTAPGMSYSSTYDGETQGNMHVFRLFPECKLQGVVVDEKGKPVRGSEIRLQTFWGRANDSSARLSYFAGLPHHTVKTGADGKFAIRKLPAPAVLNYSQAAIQASSKNRATVFSYIDKSAMAASLKIVQPTESVVEGVLYLPGKSSPAPAGTPLTVMFGEDSDSPPRPFKTGAGGRFHVDALPPGDATVVLGSSRLSSEEPLPWALTAVTDMRLTPGSTHKLDLVLSTGALLQGRAINKATREPLEDESLVFWHAGNPKAAGRSVDTDGKGQFCIRVVAGEVSVESEYARYWSTARRTPAKLTVADGEVKTVGSNGEAGTA